jgi:hypothetical protein
VKTGIFAQSLSETSNACCPFRYQASNFPRIVRAVEHDAREVSTQ